MGRGEIGPSDRLNSFSRKVECLQQLLKLFPGGEEDNMRKRVNFANESCTWREFLCNIAFPALLQFPELLLLVDQTLGTQPRWKKKG